jgi:hypothetical protein
MAQGYGSLLLFRQADPQSRRVDPWCKERVIPAKAGIQGGGAGWTPAFARGDGMDKGRTLSVALNPGSNLLLVGMTSVLCANGRANVQTLIRGTYLAAIVVMLPWAAAAACVGDCNGDGEVTVDEIVTGTGIALGASLSLCPTFDANGDGEVTIEELVVAVTHALLGCPMDADAPIVLYDRTQANLVPWPDDFWTRADDSTATGLRLNLPANLQGILRLFLREANRLDGFSPVGHLVIELSEPPDPASLPGTAAESLDPLASIGLFGLDPEADDFARRIPFRLQLRTDTGVSGIVSHALLIYPSVPLRPGGRYGLVVTRGVRVDRANGSLQRRLGVGLRQASVPLEPSAFFRSALGPPVEGEPPAVTRVRALAGEVLEVVGTHVDPPIAAEDVALALRISIRTTDDIPADLLAIKEDLLAAEPPAFSIDQVEPGHIYGPDVAALVRGTWQAPEWRGSERLFFQRDANGRPMRTRTQVVPFVLALPLAALDGPVPVVMYQHGNPGSAEGEVPGHAARSLAAAGFAVIGFTDNLNREVSKDVIGNEQKIAAQVTAIFFALVDQRRVPDYWAQTNAEQLAFLRMIQGMGELDVLPLGAPDGVPDLDPSLPLSYVGISQGANHAPGFLPYAPEIRAAALVVGGGRLAETLLHQQPEAFLTELGPLDERLSPAGIWTGLALFQALFDQQESHNHGRFLYRDPLPVGGTTRKASILMIEGLDDSLVPNNATDSLAWAIGPLPHLSPVQRPVPYLEVVDGPLFANIDAETTAAFYQYVPLGVPGIDPTPGCRVLSPTSANEGHYCAQGAQEALRQRVVFFQSAVRDGIPMIIDPLSDDTGMGVAAESVTAEFEPAL